MLDPESIDQAYTSQVSQRLAQTPPKRKSVRTREALKLATAKLLEKMTFGEMRVIDITTQAAVSEATFYTYFTDKREITFIVLKDLLHHSALIDKLTIIDTSPYEAILQMNRSWFSAYRANRQLVYCLLQFNEQDQEFSPIHRAHHQRAMDLIFEKVVQTDKMMVTDESVVRFMIFALGAMMDEVARQIYVFPNPLSQKILDNSKLDHESLVHALTVIWHRTLYPGLPLPETAIIDNETVRLMEQMTTRNL